MSLKMFRIAAVAAFVLFVVGCVTTEEEPAPVAVEHLWMEPEFTTADGDKSGHLTKEVVAAHQHADLLVEYDLDRDNHISEAARLKSQPHGSRRDAPLMEACYERFSRYSVLGVLVRSGRWWLLFVAGSVGLVVS